MASSGEAAGTGPLITVQVRTLSTGNHDVRVPPTATVGDVKQQLVRPTGLPVERQRVIYSGRVLEDSQSLASAGIADGHTLHLVEQDPAHQAAAAAAGGAAAAPGWGGAQPDMLSALLGAGGAPGNIEAHVLGPFELGGPGDAAGWQQMQQQIQAQIAAAMQGMGAGGAAAGGAGAAPGVAPGAAGAAGGAAPPGGASPFNFANLFGRPAGGAGRGQGAAGGRGGAGGRGAGAQQAAGGQWPQAWPWMADWQGSPLTGDGGSHLLDGLELLLEQMEEEGQQGQQAQQQGGQQGAEVGALPTINHIDADLQGVPAPYQPAWRRQLSHWQHNFLHAAQAVLETAQLSAATRAATNRVLAAGGVETVPVTGEEGATEAERRIRSFPVLEHLDELSEDESPPVQPATVASGGSPAVARRAGQPLGQQRIQELSQRQQRQARRAPRRAQRGQQAQQAAGPATAAARVAAAAQAAAAAPAEEQDGAVEDYHSDEEGQQRPQAGAAATSPESEYSDLPALEDDWSTEEDEEPAQQAQRAERPQLPHADMLLLAAVCVGDLACRFLLSLGANREGSQHAATLAAAERLRGLAAVPMEAGAARDTFVADVRLLVRQFSRLGAASVELMRALQYLGSGLEENNAYFAGATPGYIRTLPPSFDAVPALPRPLPRIASVGVPTTVDIAVVQGAPMQPGQPGQQAGGWQQMLANLLGRMGGMGGAAGMPAGFPAGAAPVAAGGAPAAGGAAGAAAGQAAAGAAGQQPAVRLHVGPPGQAVPVAIPLYTVGGAAGQPGAASGPAGQQQQPGATAGAGAGQQPAGQAAPMSPELSNMARLLMAQLGVGPAEQQQLLGQFGGMMAALRSSSVASLNVPQIAREVGTAVQRVVQEQSSGLRGALAARSSRALATPGGEQPADGAAPAGREQLAAEATALATRLGPAITGEVQRVLQAHLGRVRHDPLVEAFAPYLEQMGIDMGEEEAAGGQGQQEAQQQGAAPVAAAAGPQAAPAAAPAAPASSTQPAAPTAAAPARAQPPTATAAAVPTAAPAVAGVQAAARAAPTAEAAPAARQQPAAQPLPAAPAAATSAPAAEAAGPSRPAGAPSSSGGSKAAAPAGLGRGFLLPRKPAAKKAAPTAAAAAGEASTSAAPAAASGAAPTAQPEPAAAAAPAAAAPSAPVPTTAAEAETADAQQSAGTSAGALTTVGPRGAAASGGQDVFSLLGAALGGHAGGAAPGRTASRSASGALAAPSAAGGAAAGGGGGLMGMLQGMMNNPALVEIAQSPAMQRMAEQMFAGGGSGGAGGAAGGGGGLAGMMNAMAPMMGELLGGLGGGAAAGGRARSARQLPANLPLEEALARAGLAAEDAARWKATLESDETAQADAPPQAPLSDAYLAALPPRTAAGLLLRDDDDEGEWTEGEEEGSGAAAAAQ